MSVSDPPPIVCPQCGKRFRRRPEFVGRPLPCPCGHTFVVEEIDETASDAGGGLTADDFESPVAGAASNVAQAATLNAGQANVNSATASTQPPPSSSSRNDGKRDAPAYRSPIMEALERREDEVGDSPWRERYVPAAALIGGAAVHVLLWLYWLKGAGAALTMAGVAIGVQVVVFGPAMFAALAAVARWLDAGLTTLRAMLVAIAAVTLGPAAVADTMFIVLLVVADFDWWMIVAGFGFHFVLTGPLIALTLRFNVAETALTLSLCFVPRIVFAFIAAAVLSRMELVR